MRLRNKLVVAASVALLLVAGEFSRAADANHLKTVLPVVHVVQNENRVHLHRFEQEGVFVQAEAFHEFLLV